MVRTWLARPQPTRGSSPTPSMTMRRRRRNRRGVGSTARSIEAPCLCLGPFGFRCCGDGASCWLREASFRGASRRAARTTRRFQDVLPLDCPVARGAALAPWSLLRTRTCGPQASASGRLSGRFSVRRTPLRRHRMLPARGALTSLEAHAAPVPLPRALLGFRCCGDGASCWLREASWPRAPCLASGPLASAAVAATLFVGVGEHPSAARHGPRAASRMSSLTFSRASSLGCCPYLWPAGLGFLLVARLTDYGGASHSGRRSSRGRRRWLRTAGRSCGVPTESDTFRQVSREERSR